MAANLSKAVSFQQKRERERQQGHQRQPKRPVTIRAVEPTPEQIDRNDWHPAGMAYRKIAVIDQLLNDGKITAKHHSALWYYRQQAHQAQDDAAEHSPSSPERMMSSGTGGAVTGAIPKGLLDTSAQQEVYRIEADLGGLVHVTRSIVVDDKTLTQYAIESSGGREKLQGRGVVIVPRSAKAVQFALLDLKFAAGRISY